MSGPSRIRTEGGVCEGCRVSLQSGRARVVAVSLAAATLTAEFKSAADRVSVVSARISSVIDVIETSCLELF